MTLLTPDMQIPTHKRLITASIAEAFSNLSAHSCAAFIGSLDARELAIAIQNWYDDRLRRRRPTLAIMLSTADRRTGVLDPRIAAAAALHHTMMHTRPNGRRCYIASDATMLQLCCWLMEKELDCMETDNHATALKAVLDAVGILILIHVSSPTTHWEGFDRVKRFINAAATSRVPDVHYGPDPIEISQ